MKPKIGDKIKTFFGDKDGYSTVLDVKKYNGKYPEYFKWFVTLTAESTRARKIVMAL